MFFRAPPDINSDTRDQAADRLAFEAADDDSHVSAMAIASGIFGLIALLALVQYMEVLL